MAGFIIDDGFIKILLVLYKKSCKIWDPKFWLSYHYRSVEQTGGNQNLQKLLKSKLLFIRYCHLTFVCNRAGVKSTAWQICNGKKNTPWQGVFFYQLKNCSSALAFRMRPKKFSFFPKTSACDQRLISAKS